MAADGPRNLADVEIEEPSSRRRDEFLAAVARSRELHGVFASPPSDAAAYDAWLARIAADTHFGHFVIEAASGALAGVVNVNEVVRGGFQSGYLGYYAFVPHAGRGLLRAGLSRVLDRVFGELGLHRVEANIQPENDASLALVRRLGFRREGFSPGYLKVQGEWRDHERFALTREEWRAGGEGPRRRGHRL